MSNASTVWFLFSIIGLTRTARNNMTIILSCPQKSLGMRSKLANNYDKSMRSDLRGIWDGLGPHTIVFTTKPLTNLAILQSLELGDQFTKRICVLDALIGLDDAGRSPANSLPANDQDMHPVIRTSSH